MHTATCTKIVTHPYQNPCLGLVSACAVNQVLFAVHDLSVQVLLIYCHLHLVVTVKILQIKH